MLTIMRVLTTVLFALICLAAPCLSQSTAFSYQGNLTTGGNPANGNHRFEVSLFDAPTLGVQIGTTVILDPVAVTNGTFVLNLDFGNQFDGADRFIEIKVKPSVGGNLTTLSPRQRIFTVPYSVKSLASDNSANAANAAMLGGLPPAGYLLNTTGTQPNSSLNISGQAIVGGRLGIGTQSPGANLNVVGVQPPDAVGLGTPGQDATDALTVVGARGGRSGEAGQGGDGANVSIRAGDGGTSPQGSLAEGDGGSITLQAGLTNKPNGNGKIILAPEGGNVILAPVGGNVGVGTSSPASKLTVINAAPGITDPSLANIPPVAVRGEATSTLNSNIGVLGVGHGANGIGVAGITNGTGSVNGANAIAVLAISTDTTGDTIGVSSEVMSPNGTVVDISMPTGGTGFLIHATSGAGNGQTSSKFSVTSGGLTEINGSLTLNGTLTAGQLSISGGNLQTFGDVQANQITATGSLSVGGNLTAPGSSLQINKDVILNGTLTPQLLTGGDNHLCNLTGTSTLRFCSSSLRYKTNVQPFSRGMELIRKLKPISFDWRENGLHDFGLGAEDVKKVEPRLTFDNANGEVEGVKYSQLSAVFVNALNELQDQLKAQNELIQKQELSLKKLTGEVRTLKRKLTSRKR